MITAASLVTEPHFLGDVLRTLGDEPKMRTTDVVERMKCADAYADVSDYVLLLALGRSGARVKCKEEGGMWISQEKLTAEIRSKKAAPPVRKIRPQKVKSPATENPALRWGTPRPASRKPVKEKPPQGSNVYLVQVEPLGEGAVKIGYSGNLKVRMKELQVGNDRHLHLLGVVPGGKALEKELQAAVQGSRKHGEWFYYTDEVRALIEQVKSRDDFTGYVSE